MSAPLWIGTAIIFATNAVVGQPVLPLCILATILASRLAIDPVMRAVARKPSALYPLAALMFVLTIPLAAAVDYGASVFLFVMLGYMVRNQDSLPFNKSQIFTFAVVAALLHGAMQVVVFFGFDGVQKIVAETAIMAVALALTRFSPRTYDDATLKMPAAVQGCVRFCGRRSLEIYVVHFALFKIAALRLGVEGYSLFNFHMY
jgi:peptidoglycan/LPS O-acetylase OafA/YrhL